MDEQVLRRLERKYFTWTLTGVPEGVLTAAVSFDDGATWTSAGINAGAVKLLLAGPDADPEATGAVVLAAGTYFPLIKVEDNPEIIIDDSDPIYVRD